MALKNFEDAVAVVTGGASGIGLATARALYAKGAHVVLADINSQGLELAEREIGETGQHTPEMHKRVLSVPTDVTNEQQVEALMRHAVGAYGRIDLVMTSAGIARGGSIDSFSASDMHAMMDVNFMGTFLCVQSALPTMRKQGTGHFVLLSSVAGKLCSPLLSGYCATKWAVRGFASTLRAELYGTGIGITTVYPAWVDTPMLRREADAVQLMNIQVLLTAEQVAEEIIQAVIEDRRDLTLAPNPDIAMGLQLMQNDPEQAEMLIGKSFHRRLDRLTEQP